MVAGIEHGKDMVSPCVLFDISKQLMKFMPIVKTTYLAFEKRKFKDFKKTVAKLGGNK